MSKKHPHLKEVSTKDLKDGVYLVNPRLGTKYACIVVKDGYVMSSSLEDIGEKPIFRKERWEVKFGWGYTRIYLPIWDGKPLVIYEGESKGTINGFSLGPKGSYGIIRYNKEVIFGDNKEIKSASLLKKKRGTKKPIYSIWIDRFPLLVERQDTKQVHHLLEITSDEVECEKYIFQLEEEKMRELCRRFKKL